MYGRINNAHLVGQATLVAYRADQVRRDPAVVKAFKQFTDDLATTAKSAGALANETQAAWRRVSDGSQTRAA